ncbi:MAG TPA: hydroxyacylglutathione hydrolase, partial [Bacteroidia bacterium]|nr:hydroxyacylglutathione hydrolase [Bacteroidia bacterium]
TETLRVDRVINGTGPQPDIRKVASPLLQRLTDRGLIVPHELNLGIEATADGRIIDSDGNAQADFLTLGTLLRGALWESTAVPELRVQAAGVARHLVNLLATRTTP